MGTSRRGRKMDSSTNEDQDFETYVRECLGSMLRDMESIKSNQTVFQQDLAEMKRKLDTTAESLNLKFETLNGELHEYMVKTDTLETEVNNNAASIDRAYEKLLSLERYSRDFNLRFYNIPECPGENCIERLQTLLSEDLRFKPEIENAHRIGRPRTDAGANSRCIIAKFLYRPERLQVIQKKKQLKNGVTVTDDLIWEDRQTKKKLKDVMQQAYEEGKKPRFYHGKLYIDGVLYKNDS